MVLATVVVALSSVCSFVVASAEVETLRMQDLPVYAGSAAELFFLTDGAPRGRNPSPGTTGGAQPVAAEINISPFYPHVSGGADLPGGRRVDTRSNGCRSSDIRMEHAATGRVSTFTTEMSRESGWFDRLGQCIGMSATTYSVTVPNQRYFAFTTSEPGWVFFDRSGGRFLPLVIGTDPNRLSHLFVDVAGHMLVDVTSHGGSKSEQARRLDTTVFKVVWRGEWLQGAIARDEWREAARTNAARNCQIAVAMGRPCQPTDAPAAGLLR
ncbi:hypothetical protein ASE11_09705 [Hydrogenophaga sp. Root209]|uniref:hypothetical protein n=1 Tax=Hydrogenophaga sp. Root209 TaxID=1736490 RepID=UPI0006F23C85|nr:hypothetical protein [Hydrogenophaga sp. Root209]KRB99919.1 hypothetical protein ASE11_09705 [Hydrogenophaga sp. Root209]